MKIDDKVKKLILRCMQSNCYKNEKVFSNFVENMLDNNRKFFHKSCNDPVDVLYFLYVSNKDIELKIKKIRNYDKYIDEDEGTIIYNITSFKVVVEIASHGKIIYKEEVKVV